MEKFDTEVLIIGAGPAGMAAASELNKTKKNFYVVEKDNQVGGLAKTYFIKEGDLEFRTDNGPHRFFSQNKYLYDFIEFLLAKNWLLIERHTQQFIKGKFYDYPINALQTIKNTGISTIAKIFIDYLVALCKYKIFKKPINNFYDYVVANFGRTLGMFNMINYTEKLWGVSSREMHIDWASQRITGLNVMTVLRNIVFKLFAKNDKNVKTLVDAFYYPEFGTGSIYRAIQEKIEKTGHKIFLDSFPVKIYHDGKQITKADLRLSGNLVTAHFDYLVESIHITDFLSLLEPKPPKEILEIALKLKYRSQVHLFITLDKDSITKNQWIYFPDSEIPFARLSEMKNFSSKMSPAGKTSAFVEFFCDENDKMWNMRPEELFELALPYFEEHSFFKRNEVRNYYVFKGGKDYPVYDLNYRKNAKIIKEYLDKFENLYYVGRPGRFKYTNQDHSLEMGILSGRSIIEGKRYDLEAVGAENEYFERGYILEDK